MAQPVGSTEALVTSPKPLDQFAVTIRELDSMGRATEYSVPVPTSPNFEEWSLVQQIGMLKAGGWAKVPISQIVFALAYAAKQGLDIMQGDVYSTGEGRIAISNKAKIKLALRTGRIKGYAAEIVDTDEPIDLPGCRQKTDLLCHVSIDVAGMNKPIKRTQRLSEWFMPKNPNWAGRPSHMLELSTFAHACELIHPTDEADEAPGFTSDSTVVYDVAETNAAPGGTL